MFSNFYKNLNQLRVQKTGCDVIFEVGSHEFPAHRVVLMARMDYFRKILTEDTIKKKKSTVVLDPEIIDLTYFNDFLNYVYTLKTDLTVENIQAVYKIAKHFGFIEMIDKVEEHMNITMNIKNVGLYLSIATEFNLKSLQVSICNNDTGEWTATTPMLGPRSNFGCAVIGHKIYICGGYNGERNMNELTVFDTLTQTWTQLISMNYEKNSCAAAALDEKIYVAGGVSGPHITTVVERYSVEADWWEYVAPLTTKRSGLELVTLNGFLYAIGGWDGSDELNTVERYNPQTDQWAQMNCTNYKYHAFGSAVLNGHIYIVGENTCEMYSPADNKWTEMPSPSQSFKGRRLVAQDGKLYVVGGENRSHESSNTVEMFDIHARVWRPKMNMDVERCYHGVAVI